MLLSKRQKRKTRSEKRKTSLILQISFLVSLFCASSIRAADPAEGTASLFAQGSPEWFHELDPGLLKAVENHSRKAEAWGGLRVDDKILHKTWILKLVKFREDTIKHRGKREFLVCGDFVPVQGEPVALDVDFEVEREGLIWDVEKITIHAVDGQARYAYDASGKKVPLK